MPVLNGWPQGIKGNNLDILNAIRNEASPDYQRRIPTATRENLSQMLENITKFRPLYNEFMDALVNRIGLVILRDMSWENPLSQFKMASLQYGSTIEEIKIGLIKAKGYDVDRETGERVLFGTHGVDVESNFHTISRADRYDITINDMLLRRAFLEAGGLSSFVSQLLNAPMQSDQWDEFLLMTRLFSEYERNGGFYHIRVPDVSSRDSGEAEAKAFLRRVREASELLKFISTRYNAARMPAVARPEDLFLFLTPQADAAIDVEALAGAFNLDKADINNKKKIVPPEYLGIKGCQAILTTTEFFMVADVVFENTNQYNPANLQTNYFLHHHQIISASRFAPAIMFGETDDEVITISTAPGDITNLTLTEQTGTVIPTNGTGNVTRGMKYQANCDVVGDDETTDKGIAFEVVGNTSGKTRVTNFGVLSIGLDEEAETIIVKLSTTGHNPDNIRDDPKTAQMTFNVVGDSYPNWPVQGETVAIVAKGVRIPIAIGDNEYDLTSDVLTWTEDEVNEVYVIGNGPLTVVNKTAVGAVLTVTVDEGIGVPAKEIKITLISA